MRFSEADNQPQLTLSTLLLDLNIEDFDLFKSRIEAQVINNPAVMAYLKNIQPKNLKESNSMGFTCGDQYHLICLAHFLITTNVISTTAETTPLVFKKLAGYTEENIKQLLCAFYVTIPREIAKNRATVEGSGVSVILKGIADLTSGATQSIQTNWTVFSASVCALWNRASQAATNAEDTVKTRVADFFHQKFFPHAQRPIVLPLTIESIESAAPADSPRVPDLSKSL